MKRIITLFTLMLLMNQVTKARLPEIGAEIWIEPGNTKEQIFKWVEIAAQQKMSVVRIFAMWTQMEPEKNSWNFDVYDWIFEAAEKYRVRMQVTLTANQPPAHYGKEYWSITHTSALFRDERLIPAAAKYIELVVNRYKNSPAMETWWLMNEPTGFTSFDEFSLSRFRTKMKEKYKDIKVLNRTWQTDFASFADIQPIPQMNGDIGWSTAQPYYDWATHCADHLTDFQKWVYDEIRKYDTGHKFHTNPTDVLPRFHMQQTSQWRPFLNSLGSSIHASWHFARFNREQYTTLIAAMCEITKANAYPNPFWVSELQAGNNTFSGNRPMCPTYNDIAQWTWTGIGQGAEKIIYWCLNPRLKGGEAGEWSMLDFLDRPTERLQAATSVVECMEREAAFFDGAKPVETNITVLLSPESNLMFRRKQRDALEGIKASAHINSALACYEALAERGVACSMVQMQDFDWEGSQGKVAILPNALCIPQKYYPLMKKFVERGNKLVMTGMSGHFDESETNMFQLGTPIKEVFGAELCDYQMIDNLFDMQTSIQPKVLPVHGWIGIFKNNSATPVCSYNGHTTGIRNQYGKGEVLWIPCNIELGAWIGGNAGLSEFLISETKPYAGSFPFMFAEKTENVTMQTMYNGKKYFTVVNNGTGEPRRVKIQNKQGKTPRIIFSTNRMDSKPEKQPEWTMNPWECTVMMWE